MDFNNSRSTRPLNKSFSWLFLVIPIKLHRISITMIVRKPNIAQECTNSRFEAFDHSLSHENMSSRERNERLEPLFPEYT